MQVTIHSHFNFGELLLTPFFSQTRTCPKVKSRKYDHFCLYLGIVLNSINTTSRISCSINFVDSIIRMMSYICFEHFICNKNTPQVYRECLCIVRFFLKLPEVQCLQLLQGHIDGIHITHTPHVSNIYISYRNDITYVSTVFSIHDHNGTLTHVSKYS